MAKRRRAPSTDDITLYDIDPGFQDKLADWLSKKPHGVVVDLGATPEGFALTADPGGQFTDASFEVALNAAMGSRSRTQRIDPELEERVHAFLLSTGAHLTFGAANGIFNVMVSNDDAKGKASDEDLEIALVLAEEQFWENMPAHPLAAGDRAALEAAVMRSPLESEDEAQEQLHRALFVPRPELQENAHPHRSVARWQRSQGAFQPMPGVRRFMVTTGETGVILGQGLMSREEARAVGDAKSAGEPYEIIEYRAGSEDDPRMSGYSANARRPPPPPPPPSSKPFDPEAPREHYAKPHHFAVNERYEENARWTRAYINSLPDSAFLYVEPGGERDEHGRSHPLSLRHLPYKNRAGTIDKAHLRAALSRAHQERTRLPKHIKDTAFKKAEAIYEREFGHVHEATMAANMDPDAALVRYWDAISEGDIGEAREAKGALMEWLSRGGFEPDWEASGHARAEFMALTGTSMRSRHGSPHGRGTGPWRIRVAGGDVDPDGFQSYDEAVRHATGKYGSEGWLVERHSAG